MTKKSKKKNQKVTPEDEVIEKKNAEQQVDEAAEAKEENADISAESEKIEELQKENNELKDKYLRLRAEFENFRRRTMKEKLDDKKLAKRDIMSALLPVLDDFDRAKTVAEAADAAEPFSEGIRLVYQKLHGTLVQQGLEAMDSNGEAFNPDIHEAFTEIPAASEDMKGKVVDTIERGYKLNGIIIRHPKVVVGK